MREVAESIVKRHFVGAVHILKYFKSVTSFFKQATLIFFQPNFERQASKPATTLTDHSQLGPQTSKYSQTLTNLGNQVKKEEAKEEETDISKQAKYWKHVMRRTLFQLMFLITHPNGLFFQYLQ